MAAYVHPLLTISQLSLRPAKQRRGWLAGVATRLQQWRKRSRERAALAQLTQRELADFGATSADVYRELSSSFWQNLPPY